jgi:hypothetical protein
MPKRPTQRSKRRYAAKKIVRPRRRARRAAAKKEQISAFQSHEDMLMRRLAQAPAKPVERSLQIQDLVYNSAAELRLLAFKSGFNLGSEVYRNSGGSIGPLERLLENAGFGNIVYYPFESTNTFTSRAIRSHGINLGTNVHVFEAGMISGYLSTHARQQVAVKETECVFNGAAHCRFVANSEESDDEEASRPLESLPNLISAMQSAMLYAEKPKGNNNYYLAAIRPLLSDPVFSEALKFLYLSGKLLSGTRLPMLDRSIGMVANFLRIGSAKAHTDRKGRISLNLVYGHEIASIRFVDLTTALISGIAKGAYGRSMLVSRSVGMGGVYNVKMEIVENR